MQGRAGTVSLCPPHCTIGFVQKKIQCLRKRELWVRRQLRNRVYSSSALRRIWVDAAGSTAIPEPVKEEEERGCDTMIILSCHKQSQPYVIRYCPELSYSI